MTDPFDGVVAAVDAAHGIWGRHGGVDGLSSADLRALNDSIGSARRHLEALHARVANEIARQSRADLGKDGFARKQGFRSATSLIATTTGISNGEAARLLSVGEATAPRTTLDGEAAPPRHPHVTEALKRGDIGMAASDAIIKLLDRLALRVGRDKLDAAEQTLAERAPGLSRDQLNGVLARLEAHLDPDGIAQREAALRAGRSAVIRQDVSGMVTVTAQLDPESGAYVIAAIDAFIDAELRRKKRADCPCGCGEPAMCEAHSNDDVESDADGGADRVRVDDDGRSMPQLRADALVAICRHLLGCSGTAFAHATTTVVVRINDEDLLADTGAGEIDGLAQQISAATVRRMAASGEIVTCVLGGDSEILDWGRAKRLFTPAQRLALLERDGGCAFCGLDPRYTEAHHIRWWRRDAGPTDLANGVMLCSQCHHRVHDDGWEIRIEGRGVRARVWFIPPPWLDACQAPRLGGRARYGLVA